MPHERHQPVAIVGGGFSGTMLAAQLARRGIASRLIEGAGRAGRGTAYSTDEAAHLLNVRAEGMSAWPQAPEDFARFFVDQGGEPRGFAERRLFGRYLEGILGEAIAGGLVELVADQAVAARHENGGWRMTLADGSDFAAAALVLAHGNQPPEPLAVAAQAGERFVGNPWNAQAKEAVRSAAASGEDVLLIGTGLTMIDLVLSLDAAGHQGRIVALSRRGLVPRAHAEFTPAPVGAESIPDGGLLALWRWLRRRSGEAGWRAAVDAVRPHSHALWQQLSDTDRRRFLRHARPWWDVHRHRIAPQIARRIAELVGEGRLEVVAGRIGSMRPSHGGIAVAIRRRGGGGTATEHEFGRAFNCTGPLGAIGRTGDALLRGLLDAGTIREDSLGIGLEVDQGSRIPGASRLWALGPLTKGRYWEIVAVPDIRGQADAIAEDIATELKG